MTRPRPLRRLLFILSTVGAIAACGVHDSVVSVRRPLVPDSDPLPVPSDTIRPPDTNGGTVAVGALQGSSSVDDNGIAHYTVPLWVPPGRAGMQPELALEYSSRGPNGLVGMGWQLTGFSQITRCPHTVASDGTAGAIKYDATDALCLDGEHLKPVGGSGANLNYRTEHDSFALIKQDSADAFSLYEKSGRIRRYTGFKLGRVVSSVWVMTRIEDRYGNTIDIHYVEEPNVPPPRTPGSFFLHPDLLSYTGSTSASGPAANRFVQLSYDTQLRPDTEYAYNGGAAALLRRITRIDILGPDVSQKKSMLLHYDLAYTTSASTRRSLLQSVTVGDALGNTFPPTTFDWEQGKAGYSRHDTSVTDYFVGNYTAGYRILDVNGDGYGDLVYVVKDGSGNPTYAVRYWLPGQLNFDVLQALPLKPQMSFDGVYTFPAPALSDAASSLGLLMWLQSTPSDQTTVVPTMRNFYVDSSGMVGGVSSFTFGKLINVAFPADFDGDGLSDVVTGTTGTNSYAEFTVHRNLGGSPAAFDVAGTTIQVQSTATGMAASPAMIPFRGVDLDGDGRQEVAICFPSAKTNEAALAVVGIDKKVTFASCEKRPAFVDLNGDGLDDFVFLGTHDYDGIQAALNAGNGQLPGAYNRGSGIGGGQTRFFDYDLDGHPDLFLVYSDYSTKILLSRGEASLVDAGTTLPASNVGAPEFGDLDGDGLDDAINFENGRFAVYLRNGNRPDMMTRVVDGYGAEADFLYASLADRVMYTPLAMSTAKYPTRPINGGLWLVKEHTTASSGPANHTDIHKYEGAVEDIQRGFVGFNAHDISWYRSDSTEVDRRLEFDTSRQKNVDPFAGFALHDTTTIYDHGKPVHQTQRDQTPQLVYDSDFRTWWMYAASATTTEWNADANQALMRTATSTTSITSVDGVGNVLASTMVDGAGSTWGYNVTYQYDANNWLVDMPTLVVSSMSPKRACPQCRALLVKRTTAYKYDAHGSVEWEIVEPGTDANGQIVPLPQPQPDGVVSRFTHYVRDPDGQVRSITTDSDSVPTPKQRVETFYRDDADRVFVTRMQNKLGHFLHVATHPGYGVVAAAQDQNGQYSRWAYDTFARLKLSEPANGEPSTMKWGGYSINGFDQTKLELIEEGAPSAAGKSDGSQTITEYDRIGHVHRQMLYTRVDGQPVFRDIGYDEENRIVSLGRLHFVSMTAAADKLKWDAVGRLLRRDYADGRVEQAAYVGTPSGLMVHHWNADPSDPTAQFSTMTYDLAGRPTSSTEHAAAKDGRPARDLAVTFFYAPFNDVSGVQSSDGSFTSTSYDRLGRRIFVSDPSKGDRSYAYDAWGDLVGETIGSEARMRQFDDLGRANNLQTRDGTTTWTWDMAVHGLGLLASTSSPTGVTTTYDYDTSSRLQDAIETVGTNSYTITWEYGDYSRVSRLYYPTVNGSRFTLRYQYGAAGRLTSIKNDANGAALWDLLETDAAGAATDAAGLFPQFRLGGTIDVHHVENPSRPGVLQRISSVGASTLQLIDYQFDNKLNLYTRNDALSGLQETFDYDELNRLEHWAVTAKAGQSRVRYDYTDTGNLVGRTFELGAGTNVTFGYTQERGGGPYAVTTASARTFGYDGEGNQSQAGTRTTAFTAFGLPLSSTDGATKIDYKYDADNARVEKHVATGSSVDETIIVGRLYRKHTVNGVDEHGLTLVGPNGAFGYITIAADGSSRLYYLLRDHLGSTDAIVDAAMGTVIERRKFDPYGNRIDPQNPLAASPLPTTSVPYGFTGHAHDWDLGLIDMRGRVFDPSTGRFLSPDPFGDTPYSGLGLNSYAYVLDNPATFTDPTGFYTDFGGGDGGDGSASGIGIGGTGVTIGFGGGNSGGSNPRSHSYSIASWSNRLPYNAVDPAAVRCMASHDVFHYGNLTSDVPLAQADLENALASPGSRWLLGRLDARWSQNVTDLFTGFADKVSWGLGPLARQLVDSVVRNPSGQVSDGVNTRSVWYSIGKLLGIHANNQVANDYHEPLPDGAGVLKELPWSSKSVRDAVKSLDMGALEVHVASRSEAEEIFLGKYQAQGYFNVTGWSPAETKDFFGSKQGVYHWDEGDDAYPHGSNHLQIHTFAGQIIRIMFP